MDRPPEPKLDGCFIAKLDPAKGALRPVQNGKKFKASAALLTIAIVWLQLQDRDFLEHIG